MSYPVLIFTFFFYFLPFPSISQYYFKDIVATRQATAQLAKLKEQKVRSVRLESFEADGEPTEGFEGSQTVGSDYLQLITRLTSITGVASVLTSYFDPGGMLIKTVDTTDGSRSTGEYFYDANKSIQRITNFSVSTGQATEKEEHIWSYNADGQPLRMLRIKNERDTTLISFALDSAGNVAEENSLRGSSRLPSIYYYYDGEKRLTDIVTFNEKARRLLPMYIFEYNSQGAIASSMIVPEGSDNYQKWYYTYDEAGLKSSEKCFDKRRQLLGRVEYRYSK